tara:strand:+ start:1706 stop:1855 length:150 start_codon:yes stop_codon:yes gene_type:complete
MNNKKNNVVPLDSKVKKKEQNKKIIRDYLKPECEEELPEEDYPKIKDYD